MAIGSGEWRQDPERIKKREKQRDLENRRRNQTQEWVTKITERARALAYKNLGGQQALENKVRAVADAKRTGSYDDLVAALCELAGGAIGWAAQISRAETEDKLPRMQGAPAIPIVGRDPLPAIDEATQTRPSDEQAHEAVDTLRRYFA